MVISSSPSERPKAATTFSNTVDHVIATRGNNKLYHDINLPSPINTWSWGLWGTEDSKIKQPDSGSVAPWLVMFRDATTINSATNARFNVRRLALYNYQPSNSTWVKTFDGLPQWRVISNPDTTSGYTDIAPTTESDGSYSFAIPTGKVLHMAAGPWPSITEGNGVLAIVEARLLGTATDIAAAKAAVEAGADYRATGGAFSGFSTPGYHAAGSGHFDLLTGDWKAIDMLSSTLTDTQFRANHPAELSSLVASSPTPTPPQATIQPILTTPTPVPLNSFKADYFNNQTLTGTPAYSTNTTNINYNWGTGSPAAGVGADHFSARYSGSFSFDGSTYKFNATSDDGVRVYLDGQPIIDAWKDQGPTTYSASKTPTAGNHTVTVEYYENGYGATLTVNWAKVAVPTPTLTPLLTDTDHDGFSDNVEAYVGTDSSKACGVNAWPPDVDNDGAVSILDMTKVAGSYNTRIGDAKYNKRYDMDADGAIGILDLNVLANYFTQKCTNPVMVSVASRPDVYQFIASLGKVIEAETFKLNSGYADPDKNIFNDSTASGGKGFVLWSAGSAQTTTTNGFSRAILRVKADVCSGGPKLTVKIDGKTLYSQDFSSTGWTDVAVDFAAVAGANHTVRVELANDRYQGSNCDRNLRFDKVTLF